MSFPVPILRPPISSSARTPRLGLAIPSSPSEKHVAGNVLPSAQRPSSRPRPPQLRLATPREGSSTPQEDSLGNGRPPPHPLVIASATDVSEGSSHSRPESFVMVDGKASEPTSPSSSTLSALSYQRGAPRHTAGTPDSTSATEDRVVGAEREGSNHILPNLEKLSLEKGRNLDIEDLDDDGWKAASLQKKITELASLGEGAGGAVTRSKLEGGKTEFALKV